MANTEQFDYIIVGGGSAGCAAAYRLVQDYQANVLILEGGWPDNHHLIHMPAGFVKMLFNPGKFVETHVAEPQSSLDGRRVNIFQANVLGGGSSVNAMTYTRGTREDYDSWNALNRGEGPGWGWNDLLPHFIRQEANQRFGAPCHGVDGPLKISDSHHPATEISRAFILSLQQMGLPFNPDINSGNERGATYIQSTTYRGKRWSAAQAFIRPILENPKLAIRYRSAATRLLFENGQAVGVEYADLNGSTVSRAYAKNEIVLSAGTFITPKLLMLSGIGPAEALRSHGIDVKVDLPGVGQNMQDHNEVSMVVHTNKNYGYSGEDRGWPMIRNGLQYLMFGSGPVSSTGSEVTAFLNPDGIDLEPNIQFYCMGTLYPTPGSKGRLPNGATLVANLVAPESRGSLRLRSRDPRDRPLLDLGWLTAPSDVRVLSEGMRYLRRVTETAPLSKMVSHLAAPSPAVLDNDEGLAAYIRSVIGTNWHPVGSCRMGPQSDPFAVLDPSLRVRGVEGLRVLDASMMPKIISANTNGPVMAIADRGVDIMMGRAEK